MNSLFAFFFAANAYLSYADSAKPFSVDIWDYNYSMAYGLHYRIDSDSLSIVSLDEIEKGEKKILLARGIKEHEKKFIIDFLSTFPFDRLLNVYNNKLKKDGDQKRLKICLKGKIKTIDISNYYQKDLGTLFQTINAVFGNEFKFATRNKNDAPL